MAVKAISAFTIQPDRRHEFDEFTEPALGLDQPCHVVIDDERTRALARDLERRGEDFHDDHPSILAGAGSHRLRRAVLAHPPGQRALLLASGNNHDDLVDMATDGFSLRVPE